MATKTAASARKSSGASKKNATRRTPTLSKKAFNTSRPRTRSNTSRPKTAKRSGGHTPSSQTPATDGVAAAQKVLRTVKRREDALRQDLKRQKKTLKQLKKDVATHRGTVKSLKTDLNKVSKTRKSVSSQL